MQFVSEHNCGKVNDSNEELQFSQPAHWKRGGIETHEMQQETLMIACYGDRSWLYRFVGTQNLLIFRISFHY